MKSSGSDAGLPAPAEAAGPATPAPRAAPTAPRPVEVPAQPAAPAAEETPAEEAPPAHPRPTDAAEASAGEPRAGDAALGERERAILAFERKWWKHAGSKEQAIRDTFQVSSTRYYQLLNGLLDDPAALAYDPMVVGRLRRLRAARTRARRGRTG